MGRQELYPCRTSSFKILTAVNYCWLQLSRRLWWAAPACNQEGATPHPEACTYSIQYNIGMMGALGCGLGCGILVVSLERGDKLVKKCQRG